LYSLGIMLPKLCFGKRLEDHPFGKTARIEEAHDLMAAEKWSREIGEEGREVCASAVKWCFIGNSPPEGDKTWWRDLVKNAVWPL
ncbi:hypothetical protein K469DRAFT_518175, partial [Zopfia rhizophila CBS 207.26]